MTRLKITATAMGLHLGFMGPAHRWIFPRWKNRKFLELAGMISAALHAIKGLFHEIPSNPGSKSEKMFFVLSNVKNLDDFIIRLSSIVDVHKKYLK